MTESTASPATPAPREIAHVLIPVLRWTPEDGFASARPLIEEALALGVGGFLLTGGEQDAVRTLAKELQRRSRMPLLIAADFERGAGQQVRGATGLPPLAAIAALNDLESLRRAARLTAREARTMGVNWNLAPVGDLDLSDDNPIIGTRALGRDARAVAPVVAAWVEACQAEGVLGCAKHFPGLGRALTDPHVARVDIGATADLLKESDLLPFRAAIGAGVASIMTAHASYAALDPSGVPATVSREILQWLLRQQLKFDQLIVADAVTMAGVGEGRAPAETTVLALRAGCDLVLDPGALDAACTAIETALAEGTLDKDRLRLSARRRLKWAQWASPPNDWRRPSGADAAWGGLLAERVLLVEHGPVPPAGTVTEIGIVDDDVEVAEPDRVPRTVMVEGMRLAGHDARVVESPTPASGSPFVIAVFADYLPGKSRTTLLEETRRTVARLIQEAGARQRSVVLVGFGDPRLIRQLGRAEPTIQAWSGDRVMQLAAGRMLLKKPR